MNVNRKRRELTKNNRQNLSVGAVPRQQPQQEQEQHQRHRLAAQWAVGQPGRGRGQTFRATLKVSFVSSCGLIEKCCVWARGIADICMKTRIRSVVPPHNCHLYSFCGRLFFNAFPHVIIIIHFNPASSHPRQLQLLLLLLLLRLLASININKRTIFVYAAAADVLYL